MVSLLLLDATNIADPPVARLLDRLIIERRVATEATIVDVLVGGVRRFAIVLDAELEIGDLRAEVLSAGLSTLDMDDDVAENDVDS